MSHSTNTAALQVARRDLDNATPQGISNVLWALATLRYHDPRTVDALLSAPACSDLANSEFTSQGIANVLWALATLGHPNRERFEAFLTAAGSYSVKMREQELSNTLWAAAVWVSKSLNAQLSASLDDAVGSGGLPGDEAEAQAVEAVAYRSITSVLNSLSAGATGRASLSGAAQQASGGWYSEEINLVLQQLLLSLNADSSPQALASSLWALASLRHPNRPAFVALMDAAVQRRAQMDVKGISMTLWACGIMEHK